MFVRTVEPTMVLNTLNGHIHQTYVLSGRVHVPAPAKKVIYSFDFSVENYL